MPERQATDVPTFIALTLLVLIAGQLQSAAEPLTGTNVIGKVLDAGSLAKMREGTTVYVREVK